VEKHRVWKIDVHTLKLRQEQLYVVTAKAGWSVGMVMKERFLFILDSNSNLIALLPTVLSVIPTELCRVI
jgi:hypothetical protein